MSIEKQLQDAFKNLKKRDVSTFSATVKSVDKSNGTCVVVDDGLEYTDVRLASVINAAQKKWYLFPVVGSSVLVSPINESELQLYVEVYGEIEEFKLLAGNLLVQFDGTDNKIAISNDKTSLYELFTLLLNLLKQLKVTTPAGVSGTPVPDTILAINEVETKFKQILKDN